MDLKTLENLMVHSHRGDKNSLIILEDNLKHCLPLCNSAVINIAGNRDHTSTIEVSIRLNPDLAFRREHIKKSIKAMEVELKELGGSDE